MFCYYGPQGRHQSPVHLDCGSLRHHTILSMDLFALANGPGIGKPFLCPCSSPCLFRCEGRVRDTLFSFYTKFSKWIVCFRTAGQSGLWRLLPDAVLAKGSGHSARVSLEGSKGWWFSADLLGCCKGQGGQPLLPQGERQNVPER